jgi:hypothetical protein
MKNEKEITAGTQDFNVETPLQQREVKTTGASQQKFTISRVFTNAVGYLMMRLTLVGGLQGIYIAAVTIHRNIQIIHYNISNALQVCQHFSRKKNAETYQRSPRYTHQRLGTFLSFPKTKYTFV